MSVNGRAARSSSCPCPTSSVRPLFVAAFLLVLALDSAPMAADQLSALRPHSVDPPTPEEITTSIHRGIEFLLEVQNEDGSWGSPHRTKALNIYAPVPGAHHGFRAATTALCVAALVETRGRVPEARPAIARAETWLAENLPRLRRANAAAIYNVWGHGYALLALARLAELKPDDEPRRQRLLELMEQQLELLERYESVDGGWGYYDFHIGAKKPASSSTSFVTAAILVALKDAERVGLVIPEKLTRRAIASIERQRKPDFSYLYGEYLRSRPMRPINRPGGSLGRSQACNLALRLWGDPRVTDGVVKTWLDRLFARNLWLDIGRKRPVPHEAWFQVAGYFYYFGHYYAALSIETLEAEDRPYFRRHLAHLLLPLQEKDGSWWDYPLYNYYQQYGTAFALMTLWRCLEKEQVAASEGWF